MSEQVSNEVAEKVVKENLLATENHVSISMSTYLHEVVRQSNILEVDVDTELLQTTLTELGELDQPHSSLHIHLEAFRLQNHPHGVMFRGETGERHVLIPLFSVTKLGQNDCAVTYSQDEINHVMIHELRHAIDYDDQKLLANEIKYRESLSRREQVAKVTAGIGALGLGYLGTDTLLDASNSLDAANGAITILVGGAFAWLSKHAIHQEIETRKKFRTPFEKRAYQEADLWKDDKRIPPIVTIRTSSD